MTNDKEMLNNKKAALLTELESIKDLLVADSNSDDNIPVLKDAIIEETADELLSDAPEQFINSASNHEALTTPEEEMNSSTKNNSVLPGQQSLFNETSTSNKTKNQTQNTASSLSKNPFLPPHVRQRFEQAPTETATPVPKPTPNPAGEATSEQEIKKTDENVINASYTERLVDQLVAHHMPKIEEELRAKLRSVVKLHNERQKNNV